MGGNSAVSEALTANSSIAKRFLTAGEGCFTDRINIGGDAAFYVQKVSPFTGDNDSFAKVHHVSILTDVAVNKMIAFHLDTTWSDSTSWTGTSMPISSQEIGDNALALNEAYATFSDFSKTPVYAKAGKYWADFGTYMTPYPVVKSIHQSFVQANPTSLELGFASNKGITVSGFVYENEDYSGANNYSWDQYGVRAAAATVYKGAKVGLDLNYLKNYKSFNGSSSTGETFVTDLTSAGNVGAWNIGLAGEMRNFKLAVQYFAATKDLGGANTTPKVTSVAGAYAFDMRGYKGNAHVAYETQSDSGSALFSNNFVNAQDHYDIGFDFDVAPYTILGIDYHDFTQFDAAGGNDQKSVVLSLHTAF